MSPTAMGASLLKGKCGFDRLEDVFDLLATGRNDDVLDLLLEMDEDAFSPGEDDAAEETEDEGTGEGTGETAAAGDDDTGSKQTDTLQRFMQS